MQWAVSRILLRTVWIGPPCHRAPPQLSTDDNKTRIAKSGALMPLTRLARSKDMRVQRNATGALLNMTHSGKLLRLGLFHD